jgi:hypothetical protein
MAPDPSKAVAGRGTSERTFRSWTTMSRPFPSSPATRLEQRAQGCCAASRHTYGQGERFSLWPRREDRQLAHTYLPDCRKRGTAPT